MRDMAILAGLVSLFGLTLVTATTNVRSKQLGYQVAERMKETRKLRLAIEWNRDQCRVSLETRKLAAAVADLGLTDEDLFPNLPAPIGRFGSGLAMGTR